MTEQQAKTKWCPMVRFAVFPDGKVESNHPVNHNNTTKCIASDCMMWRWDDPMHGHCGIAGVPISNGPASAQS